MGGGVGMAGIKVSRCRSVVCSSECLFPNDNLSKCHMDSHQSWYVH